MLISGKNSVYEALQSGITINKILIAKNQFDKFNKDVVALAKAKKIKLDFADKQIMDKMAEHNQGYIADVTEYTYFELEDILEVSKIKNQPPFIVVLDGIEDPHNLGSIVRVCDCAGVDGIIIQNRRSVAVTDTVFKTSCGAINYVKVARVTNINDAIKTLKKQNIWVFAADMDGQEIYKTNLTGSIAIVIGGEGCGVSKLTRELCDGVVSLPMFGKVNSLNASTATSAVVYEVIRQRNK